MVVDGCGLHQPGKGRGTLLVDFLLPVFGFDAVNLDRGTTVFAEEGEAGEGETVALFSGEDVEALGLDVVGLETEAKLKAKGKDALSFEVAELGGETVVFDGGGFVLGMSVTAKEKLLGEVKELLCFAEILRVGGVVLSVGGGVGTGVGLSGGA
jgi:hypothetical protein